MKEYLGWVQGSEMAGIYVHLSGRDVDDAVLNLYGLQPEKPKDGLRLRPATCGHCNAINGFANTRCTQCGNLLRAADDVVAAQPTNGNGADNLLDKMLEDPAFKHVFTERARSVMNSAGRQPLSFAAYTDVHI